MKTIASPHAWVTPALAAALLVLVASVYLPVRHHDFVDLDDYVTIVTHPAHQAPLSWPSVTRALTRPYHLNWIPLSSLSLQADVALFGIDAGRTLLVNALLHAVAALLLALALLRLSGALAPSLFVAAVFAVHPLHVESVAWASQRKDVLAGVFFGLTLWTYARYAERPDAARWLAVTAALVLGLLSKATLVTAPFVLLLLDAWPLDRLRREPRRAVLEKLPWIALAGLSAFVTWTVQRALGAADVIAVSWPARLANAGLAYAAYVRDALWPTGLHVAYLHPGDSFAVGAALAAWAGVGLALAAAWRLRRSHPSVLLGLLWFLGMLVPMIGLLQVGDQARADRYTYLPLSGLAIALAFGVRPAADASRGRRVAAGVAAVAAVGLLTVAARSQVHHWRDTTALFERVLSLEPDHAFAHWRLAVAHGRDGALDRAGAHYAEVFRLLPDQERPRFEWGSLLEQAGRRDEALPHYAEGVRLRPDYGRGHAHLGVALRRAGRPAEALPHLDEAIRQHPDRTDLRRQRAAARNALGRCAEAVEDLRRWVELDPRADAARNDLAWALATCADADVRRPVEAVSLAARLVRQNRGVPNLLDTLAAAQASAGRFARAVESQRRALAGDLDPATRRAYEERLALYERGEPYIERR
ncbi:MAG: tetratricopeptide repeat protein [Myxococcota bacterium]